MDNAQQQQLKSQMLPIGPGGPQSGFSTPGMYQGAFAKKIGFTDSLPPPGVPPVLGSLVRSAEGQPSTHNWPLSATHQPAPGDTQGNVGRQLAALDSA
jgi:hypothetical protein